jgi:hypothetical protein
LERESRYWVTAQAGRKEETLFTQGTHDTWAWAQDAHTIRWFTDEERRYGKALWPLASERLIHNWARPHWGLQGKKTPAMVMGFTTRPISMAELLNSRGFEALLL